MTAVAVLAGMSCIDPSVASAQWWRGRMQQIMVQQAQATQKMMEENQKQQEADEKAFLDRFDTNHDGKISGKEKGPAMKYLREREMGLDPDAGVKKQKHSTMKLGKPKRSAKSTKPAKSSKDSKEPKEDSEAKDSKEPKESKDSNP
ncbi:MAG TPA: hypothetical protein VGX78_22895 [Pirellulales bacterium]|nr:hypothetical protein [Pirellulales bacterium]